MLFELKKALPHFVLKIFYRNKSRKVIEKAIDKSGVKGGGSKKNILIINHFFSQDVKALKNANKTYNILDIEPVQIFAGAKNYFSEGVRSANKPYAAKTPIDLMRWRQESEKILEIIESDFKIDCLITPSDVFYWIREFISILKEKEVPVVVLDKEGTISPYTFEAESKRLRENAWCISDYVLVWSERQKDYWIKRGFCSDSVFVVGQPRSDLFFIGNAIGSTRFFNNSNPIVTFFSFDDHAYVPIDDQGRSLFSWSDMKIFSHEVIVKLASEYLNYNFIIKTHPQQSDAVELARKNFGPNIKVISGASSTNEILVNSCLVIGFQTTALIESMFIKKPVIYICWDKNIKKVEEKILPLYEAKGIEVVKKQCDFAPVVRKYLDDEVSLDVEGMYLKNKSFIDRYLYRPDGNVCERVFRFLDGKI